jgi:hypothetical protein
MRTIFGLTSSLLLMLAAGAGAVEDGGPLPADGRCAPFSQTEPGHAIPSWDGTPLAADIHVPEGAGHSRSSSAATATPDSGRRAPQARRATAW